MAAKEKASILKHWQTSCYFMV